MLRAVRLAAKVGVAIDAKTAAPIPKLARPHPERAAGAPVRRDAEAAAVGPRGGDAEEPARARPVARAAAAARRDPRAAARPEVHRRRARRHRRARARRQAACRRRSCSRRCCGTRCCRRGTRRRAAAKSRCPRCSTRWTACWSSRRSASRSRAASRPTIKEIWSLQPRFEQRAGVAAVPAARASALSRRLRFPRAARHLGRSAAGAGRLVDAVPGRRASAEREAMLKPDEAPKKRRRSRGRGRKHQRRCLCRRAPPDAGPADSE